MPTRRQRSEGLHRRFEGEEVLAGLLFLAGSPVPLAEVADRLRAGIDAGKAPGEVFPTLFDGEPKFPDPAVARRTFENLFGLWDLLRQRRPWQVSTQPPRVQPPKPVRPEPFGEGGPDAGFVEAAWRYLDDVDDREWSRQRHTFENRQDALLGWLDELPLTDDGYGVAWHLLFELHAMLELGWPPGLRNIAGAELASGEMREKGRVPEPLWAYAEDAVFESQQDEEAPLAPDEAARVRQAVERGLHALWRARRRKDERG